MPSKTAIVGAVGAELFVIASVALVHVWLRDAPGPLSTLGVPHYDKFRRHPELMVTAFVGFGFNAVMAFRLFRSHKHAKGIHFLLHTAAVLVATIGVASIVRFHRMNSMTDFYSTHSLAGLAAYGLYVAQWLGGVLSFIMPFASQRFRAAVVPYHRWLGSVAFVAVTVAIVLGCFDRQRISWEVGAASVGYLNATDRYANAVAMSVLLAASFVSLAISAAARGAEQHAAASAPAQGQLNAAGGAYLLQVDASEGDAKR